MDDDISSAIAEFRKRGGEIQQLPDQVDPRAGPNKGETRFHFSAFTGITLPPRGPIRADYYSDGKKLSPEGRQVVEVKRGRALRRHKMHGEIAYRKRQERLSTISRY